MICLVTKQQELFESEVYKVIDEQSALEMMENWNLVQFDTETDGRNARINNLLCAQFGNDKADTRVVIDCTTVDIRLFKNILETKRIIGHNLKFDLQFLYNYGIVPRKVYDTMIAEQNQKEFTNRCKAIETLLKVKNQEEQLYRYGFRRCNNYCLVNLRYITEVCRDQILLGQEAIDISRPRKKKFMEELTSYWGGNG